MPGTPRSISQILYKNRFTSHGLDLTLVNVMNGNWGSRRTDNWAYFNLISNGVALYIHGKINLNFENITLISSVRGGGGAPAGLSPSRFACASFSP